MCNCSGDTFLISSDGQNVCESVLYTLENILYLWATNKKSFYICLPVVFKEQIALRLKHWKHTENAFLRPL